MSEFFEDINDKQYIFHRTGGKRTHIVPQIEGLMETRGQDFFISQRSSLSNMGIVIVKRN